MIKSETKWKIELAIDLDLLLLSSGTFSQQLFDFLGLGRLVLLLIFPERSLLSPEVSQILLHLDMPMMAVESASLKNSLPLFHHQARCLKFANLNVNQINNNLIMDNKKN